ncbi:MAG: hypothetical protein ACTS6P_00890 [Candidatus Hodgkinia cicadicola]
MNKMNVSAGLSEANFACRTVQCSSGRAVRFVLPSHQLQQLVRVNWF